MTSRTSPKRTIWPFFLLLTVVLSAPLLAYTVYLKDGSRLIATEQPTIEEGQAIITLQNGTRTSIAASEIDVEKTRDANKNDYGTALVLEEGTFTELTDENAGRPRGRLSDVGSQPTVGKRPAARREITLAAGDALDSWQRVPYRGNLDIATEILDVFRGQGIEQVGIYQGTQSKRLLIELSTNSESGVFRALKITAGAMSRAHGLFPDDLDAIELIMATAQRDRAGQFVLTPAQAALLLESDAEISSFYVANVRF